MPPGNLTPLQVRILVALAPIEPPWTLTGGGAMVGFHAPHRSTRDLDLFWRGSSKLERVVAEVERLATAAKLEVRTLQTAVAFHRFEMRTAEERCIVDLVAEPIPALLPPEARTVAGVEIRIDSAHELLVNKLCALLGRAELRDLLDVRELLRIGGDLERASAEASRKDGGYSAMTLGWILKGLPLASMARAAGYDGESSSLEGFRDELVRRLTSASLPEGPADS